MQQREEILIKVKDDLEAYDSENKKVKKKDKPQKKRHVFIMKIFHHPLVEREQKLPK